MSEWRPIETAPKDGQAVLLLSKAHDGDFGEANGGIHHFPPKIAIGHWWSEGTSWVDDLGRTDSDNAYTLSTTGTWLSGGGWFQPNEVTHWMPLPDTAISAQPTFIALVQIFQDYVDAKAEFAVGTTLMLVEGDKSSDALKQHTEEWRGYLETAKQRLADICKSSSP